MGRHLVPGPFLPTVTQLVPILQECMPSAVAEQRLSAVAAGELTGALAVAETPSGWPSAPLEASARPAAGGWVLEGRKRWVLDGDTVDELVVAARIAERDAVGLSLVPGSDVKTSSPDPLDASRSHADVKLGGAAVPAERVLSVDGGRALRRALKEATVALAVEMVGACQGLFTMTLEYAQVREQFGVPIGSFQAVKHKLADLYVALERARSAVYFAAMTIAEDDPRRDLAASMAKAAAGDAQQRIVQDGIQLHGGIAYTWEHDAHLYVKRLMARAPVGQRAGPPPCAGRCPPRRALIRSRQAVAMSRRSNSGSAAATNTTAAATSQTKPSGTVPLTGPAPIACVNGDSPCHGPTASTSAPTTWSM
jgi:alkylation response protein AidB-like acyl-CoA dehydrogenase